MKNESTNKPTGHISLELRGDQLRFNAVVENECDNSVQGYVSNIRNLLDKERLTSVSLESAINYTEDLIMPMLRVLPKQEMLMVGGPELEKVVNLLISNTGDTLVSIESVESLYRQLADYSQGMLTAWREAISPENMALGLVVLREIMQHGGFHFVSTLSSSK